MSVLFFIYIVNFFHFLISAATGAAAPGYSGTVSATTARIILLDFHNKSSIMVF